MCLYKPNNAWTPEEDDRLMLYMAEGVSLADAGKRLKRTKGSCQSRVRRLASYMGAG